ncbi:hypothetical protein AMTRI_Chr12g274430 [Amborella trichopoda]|uniref:Large ribosomal subunit protein bL28m n=1 Tax=Amborella trichopoda TaxID=13333 RepID=W1PHU9_AMBTC|nr:54S ribosomal protein L24, mitochondrial [Amborella trichopoda]ERN07284.1 hypothetical protein AMTR_s00019p00209010 [Amborella trichopoda]|eukprot:XP_006845609.1 54S ribosomal protein L24, mitochondrial [Amborella trichopoda]
MAFRARELYKKLVKKIGDENFAPGVKESLKKYLPDNKVVMGRAKRGLYAGRHIQFGNQVSEDGGNKTRRKWKPNVQEKRLFSYILDRHIRIKVTTHALRCIDKAGGVDEYLLNTPYNKLDNEIGLFWKARIEKMYEELGMMEVGFFPPEEEAKLEEGFKNLKIAKREARREARQKWQALQPKRKPIVEGAVEEGGVGSTEGEMQSTETVEQESAESTQPPASA